MWSSRTNFAAPLDGSRHLGKMEHAEIRFRMAKPVARERARDSFRRGHSKVVQVIGTRRVREIGINHAPRKIRAVPRDTIEMILIRRIVEFRDQLAILLFSGIADQYVDTANQTGLDHPSPFGLVTVHAWRANAER